MTITATARSRAQSAASKARADVAKATSDLSTQGFLLDVAQVADRAAGLIPGFVSSRVPFVKQFTEAQVAERQAAVDELTADKVSAETRLEMAEKTQRAVNTTIDESIELKTKATQAAKKAQAKVKEMAD